MTLTDIKTAGVMSSKTIAAETYASSSPFPMTQHQTAASSGVVATETTTSSGSFGSAIISILSGSAVRLVPGSASALCLLGLVVVIVIVMEVGME